MSYAPVQAVPEVLVMEDPFAPATPEFHNSFCEAMSRFLADKGPKPVIVRPPDIEHDHKFKQAGDKL